MRAAALCVLAAAAAWSVDCGTGGSGAPAADSGADSGADGTKDSTSDVATADAIDDAGDESGKCNDLAFPAMNVAVSAVASDPPTMTGGQIADGTYVLVSQQQFTGDGGTSGPNGSRVGAIINVAGSVWQEASSFQGIQLATTANISANGSALMVSYTCGEPPGAHDSFEYTSSASQLSILSQGPNVLGTFTRQ